MKRINRTLTAAVLAGSLALGGTAVASAQIPAPAELTVDGVTYQKQADGSYQHRNENGELDGTTKLTAEQAQWAWEQQQAQQDADAPTTTSVMAPDMDMAATGEATAPSSVDYPINGESEAEPTSAEFDKKQLLPLPVDPLQRRRLPNKRHPNKRRPERHRSKQQRLHHGAKHRAREHPSAVAGWEFSLFWR
ncbi:hypothetical protein ACGLFO_08590, partial [Corynebacterium hesseae]